MNTPTEQKKLAVLIDGDNTQPGQAEALLKEIANYGVASVKRVYGDWTQPNLRGWKDVLPVHAIQPMQQFGNTKGKNATDSAMIIDAMDLLYTNRFDGFCLVTSDSDFTRLASRIKESGLTVYGFGEKKTPKSLVAACDKFIYIEVLGKAPEPVETPRGGEGPGPQTDPALVKLFRDAIQASSDEDGWAHLGAVGSLIAKQAPDFDPRNYGFPKLSALAKAIGPFEVEGRKTGDGSAHALYVRERRRASAAVGSPAPRPRRGEPRDG